MGITAWKWKAFHHMNGKRFHSFLTSFSSQPNPQLMEECNNFCRTLINDGLYFVNYRTVLELRDVYQKMTRQCVHRYQKTLRSHTGLKKWELEHRRRARQKWLANIFIVEFFFQLNQFLFRSFVCRLNQNLFNRKVIRFYRLICLKSFFDTQFWKMKNLKGSGGFARIDFDAKFEAFVISVVFPPIGE